MKTAVLSARLRLQTLTGGVLRRHKKWLLLTLLVTIFVCTVYLNMNADHFQRHTNYFLNEEQILKTPSLITTPTCKILNLTWDPALAAMLAQKKVPPDCSRRSYRWTYTIGSTVVLNATAVKESGYELHSIDCCYQTITRVQQDINNYDRNCDSTIKISPQCVPLRKELNYLTAEFIQVKCVSKYWPFFLDVVYRNYHALTQIKTPVMHHKLNQWNGSGKERPPNVLMVGIDSLSRMNFRRTMTKTARYLTEIGAIEILGYIKVGENTFANAVPFLGGYKESEFRSNCFGRLGVMDSCPFIWKRFNTSNYITASCEDAPRMSAFHSKTKNFFTQQMDFYMRPFLLNLYHWREVIDCIGPDTVPAKTLRYIDRLQKWSRETNVPLFLFNWMTNLGHTDINAPFFADETYEDFLRRLDLNNTIMFFMSDHGIRFGGVRETNRGWLEDKLPNFWLYLPHNLRTTKPEWLKNLELNRNRIASAFDTYRTLEHILSEFTTSESSVLQAPWGTDIPRKYGQSLLMEIPLNRTCRDAGIHPEYCPCDMPQKIAVNRGDLHSAVRAALYYLNFEKLPPQCARFTLREITAGASTNAWNQAKPSWYYTAAFTVDPGEFMFEAMIKYDRKKEEYTVAKDILRMNKMTRRYDCVGSQDLQRLCYCH